MHATQSIRNRARLARAGRTFSFGVAIALLLAACTPGTPAATNSSATPTATSAAALRDSLPSDVKAAGKIVIVADPSFGPPWNYHPGDDPTIWEGIDADLAREIGQRLGVKMEFVTLAFAGIIPALMAERYDMVMTGMFARAERQKQIDQITYVKDSQTIVVAKGNPLKIAGLADLCGKSVAVPTGTTQEQIVSDYQSKCSTPIDIQRFPTKQDTFLQIRSGRSVATLDGYAVSFYLQSHQVTGAEGLEPLPNVRLGDARLGIGLPKSKTQLRDAVAATVNAMIKDGSYLKILQKWGIANAAVDQALVNPDL